MRLSQLLGGAASTVHFAGIGLGGRRAEDPKDDEPKGKKSKAADGDDDDDEDDQPKGKKSEDPKDDEPKGKKSKAADGDDDDDEDDQPKGKKSRRAEGDDDDETCEDDDDKDEMHGRSAVANARRRERARCASILGSAHAAGNVDLAASLAFNTTMTRKEAVAVLRATPPRAEERGDNRSDARRARNPDIGPEGGKVDPKKAMSSLWDKAYARAGIKTRAA